MAAALPSRGKGRNAKQQLLADNAPSCGPQLIKSLKSLKSVAKKSPFPDVTIPQKIKEVWSVEVITLIYA